MLLAEFVQDVCTLKVLRLATKEWNRLVEEEIIIHNGKNRCLRKEEEVNDLGARREPVKRVVFYPNITKVGEFACHFAINLVVVDIPEGVTSISDHTFCWCKSLTRVSFPTTLTSIGESAFYHCDSLDNVDLLHTNLQELGEYALGFCINLTSMTVPDSSPDSLQTGEAVFWFCSKLVPSIDICKKTNDATKEVITHLRIHYCTKVWEAEPDEVWAKKMESMACGIIKASKK
ncbi:hypothetical protein TrLO_g10387 [Triparma laevis f. longispina]|uniref:Uncharacterized protein n=1 Tax=Triparma laevis f. longispina TaxID=1714387 RepID=A0A9W7DS23_9STRA|nr:hypothetical protein TrLO_g10387 [Triparma laevis f. longispina]